MDAITSALIAAVSGAVGFFAKHLWEVMQSRRHKQAERLAALRELKHLLEDSKSVFQSQNYMARRLLGRLREKHADDVAQGLGFDETFYRLYDRMDAEEHELQSLIRSTTQNSMRRVNEALREWCRVNQTFRSATQKGEGQEELSDDLRQLELHLGQWFDKYEAVIPQSERRSLVYLADEKKHGVGFPNRIESSLAAVMSEFT